jgi:hypothetical protein
LNLNVLITNKLTLLNLKHQLTLDLISSASLSWALYKRRESLRINYLIHFVTTSIAGVVCNLDAWLHVGASGHDTFDDDQRADGVGSDLSHFDEFLLGFITWDDAQVVSSF